MSNPTPNRASTRRIRQAPACVVHADDAAVDVLTADALALVALMQRSHDHARRLLLERRAERAVRLRAGEGAT